jgi:hypothetical protein
MPLKGAVMPESVTQITISPAVSLETVRELLSNTAGRPPKNGPADPLDPVNPVAPSAPPKIANPELDDASNVTGPLRLVDQPMLIVSALAPLMVVASPVAAARTRPNLMTKALDLVTFIRSPSKRNPIPRLKTLNAALRQSPNFGHSTAKFRNKAAVFFLPLLESRRPMRRQIQISTQSNI